MSDRATVLVVDDEPDIVSVLAEWLPAGEFDILTAADAADARRQLAAVDALILDLHLPGEDGLSVLRAARAEDPDLAILIMTGMATTDSAVEALRYEADDYLYKPFDLDVLLHSLRRSLSARRLKIENRALLSELAGANARLDREVERKTRSLKALLTTTREIAATVDLEDVLGGVAERALEWAGAARAVVYLWDPPTAALVPRVERRAAASGVAPPTEAVATRAVAAAPGAVMDGGVLAIPLTWEGRTLGVLTLAMAGDLGGVPEEARELLESFATHAAVAIQNAQLYEQSRALERMQAAFVAAASHELRTPLAQMEAPLELLADGYAEVLDEEGLGLLKICRSSVARLDDLVDLILFATEDAVDGALFAPVAVGPLVDEAVQRAIDTALATDVEVDVQVDDPAAVVEAHRDALVRVIVCLLSNAIKFSGAEARVRLSAAVDGDHWRLSVTDRGPGIAPGDRLRMFEPFWQADGSTTKEAGGIGLGLYVTRLLVDAHQGSVSVATSEAGGTRFRVTLPRRQHTATGVRAA